MCVSVGVWVGGWLCVCVCACVRAFDVWWVKTLKVLVIGSTYSIAR